MKEILESYRLFATMGSDKDKAEACSIAFDDLVNAGLCPAEAKAELGKIDGGQFSSAIKLPEEKGYEPLFVPEDIAPEQKEYDKAEALFDASFKAFTFRGNFVEATEAVHASFLKVLKTDFKYDSTIERLRKRVLNILNILSTKETDENKRKMIEETKVKIQTTGLYFLPEDDSSEEDDSGEEGKSRSEASDAVKKIVKDSADKLRKSPILNYLNSNKMLIGAIAGIILILWFSYRKILWVWGTITSFLGTYQLAEYAGWILVLFAVSWLFKILSEELEKRDQKSLSKAAIWMISVCWIGILSIIVVGGISWIYSSGVNVKSLLPETAKQEVQNTVTSQDVTPKENVPKWGQSSAQEDLPPVVVTPRVVMPKACPTIAGQECRDESLLFAIGDYSASGIMCYKISCYKLGKFAGTRDEYWQIVDWVKAQPKTPNWLETSKLKEQIISEWGYTIDSNGYIKGSDERGQKIANEATTFFSSRN